MRLKNAGCTYSNQRQVHTRYQPITNVYATLGSISSAIKGNGTSIFKSPCFKPFGIYDIEAAITLSTDNAGELSGM
jgi:hypothetical protein